MIAVCMSDLLYYWHLPIYILEFRHLPLSFILLKADHDSLCNNKRMHAGSDTNFSLDVSLITCS